MNAANTTTIQWHFNLKGRVVATGKLFLYSSTPLANVVEHVTTSGFNAIKKPRVEPVGALAHGTGSGSLGRYYAPSKWAATALSEACNGGDILSVFF
jgi:hypothetical protein